MRWRELLPNEVVHLGDETQRPWIERDGVPTGERFLEIEAHREPVEITQCGYRRFVPGATTYRVRVDG